MATEDRKTNGGLVADSKQSNEQTTGTGRSEENPRTETPTEGGRKRGRPRTTATTENTGSTTGTTEEKGISGLVVVGNENSVPTPKPAKQKRTRTKKTTKNDVAFNEDQLKAILLTISGVLSTSESGKIFALTEAECTQIAKPLSNIIANNDSLKGLSEHSDSIALVTACAMIFLPKLFIFLQYKKQQKTLKNNGVKLIKQEVKPNDETRKTDGGNNKPNGNITPDSKNSSSAILSAIPSIM